jgi:lambda repressor-like predicted transcriptional regulator
MTSRETRNIAAAAGPGRTFLAAAPAQRLLLQQAAARAGDLTALAEALQLDRSTLYRVLGRDRLRYDAADRIAVCLGRHPSELWPEWFPTGDQADR